MARWGIHLPNGEFLPDDWDRIRALGVDDYVDLDLFAAGWPGIVQLQLGARIHARCYARGPLGSSAAEARALASVVRAHPEVTTWRWRNEPNIEAPGATPAQWADWLAAFGQEAGRLGVADRLFAPAVSPGTADWLVWLDATITGARSGGFVGLDVHAYGSPAEVDTVLAEYRKRWDGRLIVTEYNFGAGRQYNLDQWASELAGVDASARHHNVELICPFIWRWHNPDVVLPTPVDVRGTPVEAALRAIAASSAASGAAILGPDPRWGAGFQRAEALVGPFLAGEVWHWPGQQHEASMIRGERGLAVWLRRDNRTVVVVDQRHGGAVYDDLGNAGNGTFRRLR